MSGAIAITVPVRVRPYGRSCARLDTWALLTRGAQATIALLICLRLSLIQSSPLFAGWIFYARGTLKPLFSP